MQTLAEVDQPISKFSSPFPDYIHPVHMKKKIKLCTQGKNKYSLEQKLQNTPPSPGTDSVPYPALASPTKFSFPANRTTRADAFSSETPWSSILNSSTLTTISWFCTANFQHPHQGQHHVSISTPLAFSPMNLDSPDLILTDTFHLFLLDL